MAKVKILNMSPHSPSGVIEVDEARARALVEEKRAQYFDNVVKKPTKVEKSEKEIIEG
jgi:hypothetical protein